MKLSVARDFSRFPAGRCEADGPYSGEAFRLRLVQELEKGPVTVLLDGTMGYGSSFLEVAFGGLVPQFTAASLHEKMELQSEDPSLVKEIWSYINSAELNSRCSRSCGGTAAAYPPWPLRR